MGDGVVELTNALLIDVWHAIRFGLTRWMLTELQGDETSCLEEVYRKLDPEIRLAVDDAVIIFGNGYKECAVNIFLTEISDKYTWNVIGLHALTYSSGGSTEKFREGLLEFLNDRKNVGYYP